MYEQLRPLNYSHCWLFNFNGFKNIQNRRICNTENQKVIHQHQLHPLKCMVCYGITSQDVIRPFFFEIVNGDGLTVT